MKKTPCEYIVWNVLPCIRRKIAEELLSKGLKQCEVAEKIGVSSAAISQYLSDKRGKMEPMNGAIENEIKKSADAVLNGSDIISELCRICSLLKHEKQFDNLIC